MASHKLNIALVRDCPPLITLKAALETVGRPSDKDYGVLGVNEISNDKLVFAIFKTKEVKLQKVEKTDGAVNHPTTSKDTIFEASMRMTENQIGVLEVYTGSQKAIDTVGEFLVGLDLSDNDPGVEFIPLDILTKVKALQNDPHTKLFQVVSAKVRNYEDTNDDQLKGTYTVKFPKDLPPANALTFLNDHADRLESVKVKWRGENFKKPLTITIRPSAFFTIAANEADETKAKNVARRLAGTPPSLAF